MADQEMSTTEMWREVRKDQQERRHARLGPRTDEILALRKEGFTVTSLTAYQYRINGRLDLFPIHRRWHDITTNTRGNYTVARKIAQRVA